jgi:hypothetical protein
MYSECDRLRLQFMISSLPRSGSTSLARLLNCHPNVKCLVEPFHPRRYRGLFHNEVMRSRSVTTAINTIAKRWNGIKHVWESSGWPFEALPWLNDQLTYEASDRLIVMLRRNLLKRFVSNYLCRNINYWIGSKREFLTRLDNLLIAPLDSKKVAGAIAKDEDAITSYLDRARAKCEHVFCIYYEDLFDSSISDSTKIEMVLRVCKFLSLEPISPSDCYSLFCTHIASSELKWCSEETYRRIPGIERIEAAVGSDRTGWLFH